MCLSKQNPRACPGSIIRPILLILSCKRDAENGFNQACRDTYLKNWGHLIEYRFVFGAEFSYKAQFSDEIVLNCGDRYIDLPSKVYAMNRWAKENGYTYTFKADTDTYIHIPRLLASDFTRAEYIGCSNGFRGWYMAGGAGYWLGPKAINQVVSAEPTIWHTCEDMNVGVALQSKDQQGQYLISHLFDDRYTQWNGLSPQQAKFCLAENNIITIHLTYSQSPGGYRTENMHLVHQKAPK